MAFEAKLKEIQDTLQNCSLLTCFPKVVSEQQHPSAYSAICSWGDTSVSGGKHEIEGVYKLSYRPFTKLLHHAHPGLISDDTLSASSVGPTAVTDTPSVMKLLSDE